MTIGKFILILIFGSVYLLGLIHTIKDLISNKDEFDTISGVFIVINIIVIFLGTVYVIDEYWDTPMY